MEEMKQNAKPETLFDIPMEYVIYQLGIARMDLDYFMKEKAPAKIIEDSEKRVLKWKSVVNIRQREFIEAVKIFFRNESPTNRFLIEHASAIAGELLRQTKERANK
jgi:hypothetical protein